MMNPPDDDSGLYYDDDSEQEEGESDEEYLHRLQEERENWAEQMADERLAQQEMEYLEGPQED